MRFNKYYRYIVRSNLLYKFNYNNVYEVPFLHKLVLNISFSNLTVEDDMDVIKALLFLELIGLKKSYIKNIKFLYRLKTKSLIFVLNLTLRKIHMFFFADFFFFNVLPFFEKRYVSKNNLFDFKTSSYSFSFKDMNLFSNVPETFYKWKLNLYLTYLLSSKYVKTKLFIDKIFLLNLLYLNLEYKRPLLFNPSSNLKLELSIIEKKNEIFNI